MRITICTRRHCVSVALILLGALALGGLYSIHVFWLLHEMDAFYHEVVLGGVAFYGFYFGIFTLFLESRNSLARTFGRAHNVLSLCIFVYLLFDTFNAFYSRFYRLVNMYWIPIEFGEDYDAVMGHLTTLRFVAILSFAVACVQGYFVYARIVNFIVQRLNKP